MSTNQNVDLINLDFNTLKLSLIAHLRGQNQFKDYDFEGSNLNVLLDVLCYNAYKSAFFTNQLHSEAHLDSAQLYASVVSHAKDLNYIPRSARSAKATVQVSFTATKESQPYIIPKGSTFTTLVKNRSYVFSTDSIISLATSNVNGEYSFITDIYEGIYLKDSFMYSGTSDTQRFKLSNPNIDTQSITVVVYENGSIDGDNYNIATTLLDINAQSKVFFLQAAEDGYYEILFGDGILGRQPATNALIVVDYRVSNGIAGNGSQSFAINFNPTGDFNELLTTPKVITLVNGNSGAPRETKESIKYYAPRHFQVQQRGVISSDYEIMLKTQFPEINAVAAYGGEELEPPRYGKVFVAVDLSEVDGLPDSKVKEYTAFLKGRNVFGIDPIFMAPEYTYFRIDSKVRYNILTTTSTPENIKTIVGDAINDYGIEVLNDFGVTLRNSTLIHAIDSADQSIVSNQTRIYPFKKLNPTLRLPVNIDINFGFALADTIDMAPIALSVNDVCCVTSTEFNYQGILVSLRDDGTGNIRLVTKRDQSFITLRNVGTVDYSTGVIRLNSFMIDSYNGDAINVYVVPEDLDIQLNNRNIGLFDSNQINISVEAMRL